MTFSTRQRSCVIADDMRSSRHLLQSWITAICRMHCLVASNGEQAWTKIQSSPPDLVITDIEMPECSGLELMSRIRLHEVADVRRIPVLVITALVDEEIVGAVRKFGGNGLLVKPLEKQNATRMVLESVHPDFRPTDWIDQGSSTRMMEGEISPALRRMLRNAATEPEQPI